jgi:hypothetical protein
MFSAIIFVTLIWVGLILCARFGYCNLLRKNTRRVVCATCKKRADCAIRDDSSATKPCDEYTGPERRRTIRIVGSRDDIQGMIGT